MSQKDLDAEFHKVIEYLKENNELDWLEDRIPYSKKGYRQSV